MILVEKFTFPFDIINNQFNKGEADLELLAEMDTNSLPPTFPRFEQRFLEHLQAAADRHLLEKGQIRDTLGLLRSVVLI